MTIWVDADACPKIVKQLMIKAALRTGVELVFVANSAIEVPAPHNIRSVQVSAGYDVADNWIVEQTKADDLVITSDIPLAAEVVEKGGFVITHRGDVLDKQNVRAKLNVRDFMETMRSSGIHTGGPAAFSANEKKTFANQLDRYLARYAKKNH